MELLECRVSYQCREPCMRHAAVLAAGRNRLARDSPFTRQTEFKTRRALQTASIPRRSLDGDLLLLITVIHPPRTTHSGIPVHVSVPLQRLFAFLPITPRPKSLGQSAWPWPLLAVALPESEFRATRETARLEFHSKAATSKNSNHVSTHSSLRPTNLFSLFSKPPRV